jgi:integrase
MTIYKTKTGYRVQVDIGKKPDGKRDRKTEVCETKREAEQVNIEFQMLKRDLRGRSNRITLSQYIDDYFMPDKEEILRKNTIAGYKRDIELRIRPKFGGHLLCDIFHADIQKMITACPTKKTAQNARATLRCILSHAVDNELLVHNPAKGDFKMPEKIEKKKQFGDWVTSFVEHAEIIDKAKDVETRTLLVLGFCFGLRKGEILGLDWDDVNLKERIISVKQTYTYTLGSPDLTPPKTEESVRDIPITDCAYKYMTVLRDDGGVVRIHGPVVNHKGNRMSPRRATELIEKFRRKNDVPHITMTTLRHSFATAAIRSGMNVASVAKWLGHADVTTTLNRYVRPLLVNLQEDAKIVDSAYLEKAIGT